ncbi:MAG: CbtB-domain containing protein [Candidatus Nitrosotenuis sp.]|nr:MAG: CbtB-domain containing protein [Candidatus Nitrosotenuis sp.]
MSLSKEITISKSSVPKVALLVLATIFAFGVFEVGFDQGQLFSIAFGEQAYADMYIHELTHDMRHAAGFPCH